MWNSEHEKGAQHEITASAQMQNFKLVVRFLKNIEWKPGVDTPLNGENVNAMKKLNVEAKWWKWMENCLYIGEHRWNTNFEWNEMKCIMAFEEREQKAKAKWIQWKDILKGSTLIWVLITGSRMSQIFFSPHQPGNCTQHKLKSTYIDSTQTE